LNRSTYIVSSRETSALAARGGGDRSGSAANFDRPRLSAALTPPTVESTSSAISSQRVVEDVLQQNAGALLGRQRHHQMLDRAAERRPEGIDRLHRHRGRRLDQQFRFLSNAATP
jgi:hypothetical protein